MRIGKKTRASRSCSQISTALKNGLLSLLVIFYISPYLAEIRSHQYMLVARSLGGPRVCSYHSQSLLTRSISTPSKNCSKPAVMVPEMTRYDLCRQPFSSGPARMSAPVKARHEQRGRQKTCQNSRLRSWASNVAAGMPASKTAAGMRTDDGANEMAARRPS